MFANPLRAAVALLSALACTATARADDVQLWTSEIVQGPVQPGAGPKPMVWLELQQRIGDNVSNLGEFIIRPGFGIRIAPDFLALAGYHFQRNTPEGGRATNEHRIWQQLSLPLYRDPDRLILLARLRLEQRSIEGAQDLGWRARAMLRLQAPLQGRGSAGLLLWSEALIGLNDTDWGQRSRVQQARGFAGVLAPIDKRLNLEAGYMAQVLRDQNGDRVNHVANLTLNYRIGD